MSDTAAQPEAPKKTTLTVTIDGRQIEANPGELIISAAQRHGTYIPRFCYHERMNPVGMCRMCLVEVDGPRGPALTVSCMVSCTEGMVVHTESPAVKKAQDGVLEFLLINHPLDCPVCDKGGECPLQDQTLAYGPGESRFVEEKRHYEKPIAISDLVYLDRERCILCDRCTRFAKEVAGDPLIHFTHRGNNTQVLTFPGDPFASYFSGNTVQICPVGALTAKPYRFKARPWDLDQRESTCTQCSVGCRITVQSSRDQLLRYMGTDVDPVNWGWLCDKGRFSFEAVNADDRLRGPLLKNEAGTLTETSWAKALHAAAEAIGRSDGPVALIGGARGTNEDAFAWATLMRDVVKTPHVDAQLGDGLPADLVLGLPRATIDETCAAKTVLLLGIDPKEELPVLYLRLRDAAEKRRIRLVELTARSSGLSKYAYRTVFHRPGEQASALSAILTGGDLHALGIDATVAQEVADQLRSGSVVVVAGRGSLAEPDTPTIDALSVLLDQLPGAKVLPALRRGNVFGALAAGLRPGAGGMDTAAILAAAAAGRVGCLVLLGADPLSDFPDRDLARRALAGARRVVAVDTFLSESSRLADVVLAAAAFAEKDGTTTNLEGRVSNVTQKVTARGTSRPDWMIAAELAGRLGGDLGIETAAGVTDLLAASVPAFAGLTAAAVAKASRQGGALLAAGDPVPVPHSGHGAPRLDSYGLRLVVSRKLYDAGVNVAKSPAMAGLTPGAALHANPYDVERMHVATSGGQVRVVSPRTSLVLSVVADPGVPRGTGWVAFNQPNAAIAELIDSSAPSTDIRVEAL